MRVLAPVALMLSLVVAPACGGDDDDGGGGTGVDGGAGGGGGGADAAPGSGGGGLGAPCDAVTACPANAPNCVTVGDATVGFCTLQCATTPDENTFPPDTSHAACDAINESSATAACAASLQDPVSGMIAWVCALGCGVTPQGDFGQCPSNLTCQQGAPDQVGVCLPP